MIDLMSHVTMRMRVTLARAHTRVCGMGLCSGSDFSISDEAKKVSLQQISIHSSGADNVMSVTSRKLQASF